MLRGIFLFPIPVFRLMTRPLRLSLFAMALLPCCTSVQKMGSGIQAGTGAVTRPVVSGSRKFAEVTVNGSKKLAGATVSGAKYVANGATRIVTFGRAGGKKDPTPQAVAPATTDADQPMPAAHNFPKTGLLVTDAELGTEATRLEATAVNLEGGWVLNGSMVEYLLEPGASDPKALRVKGSPATAVLGEGESATRASAAEIHYHAATRVLYLKGNPEMITAGSRLSANSPSTTIKIHLPSGAMSVDGPVRWGS